MRKITLLALLLLLFTNCTTQKRVVIEPKRNENSIANYLNTISEESLRTNLNFIASDETEGRETGSDGQKKAGRFIIDFYKKNGLGFPKEATDYYQRIPAAYLNAKRNENLNDSENIWF